MAAASFPSHFPGATNEEKVQFVGKLIVAIVPFAAGDVPVITVNKKPFPDPITEKVGPVPALAPAVGAGHVSL